MIKKSSAVNAALYVLNKLGEIDMHKLFKILYFADREHLAHFGRSVTGDEYIAMNFGPVPSALYDAIKAAQGKSIFNSTISEAKNLFNTNGRYNVISNKEADLKYLSKTDVDCLDNAIAYCKDKSFEELVTASHQYAWNNTKLDTEISVADIMREAGCNDEQIEFVMTEQKIINELNHGVTKKSCQEQHWAG